MSNLATSVPLVVVLKLMLLNELLGTGLAGELKGRGQVEIRSGRGQIQVRYRSGTGQEKIRYRPGMGQVHKCTLCVKSFSEASTLRSHMMEHSGD